MRKNISVVYEKGVLRPLTPLNLPEKSRLEIRIVKQPEGKQTEAEMAYHVLLKAGLIRQSKPNSGTAVSNSERQKAAQAYGKIGPLSELIIAERDDR